MTRTLLTVAACLLVPGMAAAQYNNAPPPGYNAPPPSGNSPGPGPGTPPGYYPTRQAYASPPPSAKLEGLVLSVELGYGPGFGDLMKDTDGTAMTMSDGVSGYIPLVLGVGYRVNPLFSFGGVFQYGFLSLKSDTACGPGISCSGSDTRIGLEARLHFMTDQSFSPWISGGFGYEWFSISGSQGGLSQSFTLTGLDFDFDVGGDFRVTPGFTLAACGKSREGTRTRLGASGYTNDLNR